LRHAEPAHDLLRVQLPLEKQIDDPQPGRVGQALATSSSSGWSSGSSLSPPAVALGAVSRS
jgi:hypothetical protein